MDFNDIMYQFSEAPLGAEGDQGILDLDIESFLASGEDSSSPIDRADSSAMSRKRQRASSVLSAIRLGAVETKNTNSTVKKVKTAKNNNKCLRSRQRRQEINKAFDTLRDCLSLKKKAEKATILREAAASVVNLKKQVAQLQQQLSYRSKLDTSQLALKPSHYSFGPNKTSIPPVTRELKTLAPIAPAAEPRKGEVTKPKESKKSNLPFPPFPLFGMIGLPQMKVEKDADGGENKNTQAEKPLVEMKKIMEKMKELYESAQSMKQPSQNASEEVVTEELTHSHCA
mmetsp:Transcript_19693/g.25512  ORF Transcript_19693/g.25512 Transcript_19693/m.25512 type:complete len:285 (-) Transcript_19693:1891-2745(-)